MGKESALACGAVLESLFCLFSKPTSITVLLVLSVGVFWQPGPVLRTCPLTRVHTPSFPSHRALLDTSPNISKVCGLSCVCQPGEQLLEGRECTTGSSHDKPFSFLTQQKVGVYCVPVNTVLGRKTVSNILEYLKKMFKGRVKGTLLFFFFFFDKDIKTEGRSIRRSKTGRNIIPIIKPNGPSWEGLIRWLANIHFFFFLFSQ